MSLLTQFYNCGTSGDTSSAVAPFGFAGISLSAGTVSSTTGIVSPTAFTEIATGGRVSYVASTSTVVRTLGTGGNISLTTEGSTGSVLTFNNVVGDGITISVQDSGGGLAKIENISSTSISFTGPNITTIDGFLCGPNASGNCITNNNLSPSLTTVTNFSINPPPVPGSNWGFIGIRGAALTAASVEEILVSVDSVITGFGGGTINLSGGTSSGVAALTAAAAAARTSLTGKGWTITLNA